MELLSPAGNYKNALTAFNAGADAIYIGGKAFSARMSAENFSNEEIISIIQCGHMLGKKIYVTMNTLLYQDEFFKAVEYAEFLHINRVDGIIIQDLGLAFYLHQVFPSLPLHASTQINCHNLAQAKALKKIGFTRIVLARESNLNLIKEISNIGLEVEVFIHGALCTSYSGNCLMSSFIGSRSGNRGRCAQPCRLKYSLENENERLVEANYALSSKDLMTIDHLKEIVNAGAISLKIEGRLKNDDYIYMVTKTYRYGLDNLKQYNIKKINEYKDNLQKIFSRRFTNGYILNENPTQFLNQQSSSHQGVHIGRVIKVIGENIYIKLDQEVHRLDGIRFNNDEQIGLNIEKMFVNNNSVEQAHKNEVILIKHIRHRSDLKGVEVIKTRDYLLNKEIEQEQRIPFKKPIYGKIISYIGKPLYFEVRIDDIKIAKTNEVVQQSEKINNERIISQFNKTGDYPFIFDNIIFEGDENSFCRISSINHLRNEVLDALLEEYKKPQTIEKREYAFNYNIKPSTIQYKYIDNLGVVSNYKDKIIYSKRDEQHYLYDRIEDDFSLIDRESIVHFVVEGNHKEIASPYCNITNSYTLDALYFLNYKEGILSLELNYDSIKLLMEDFYQRHKCLPNVGMYIYGYIDLMIMKACPVATMYNLKNLHCQKCHQDNLYLKDRLKVKFPLYGDKNCHVHILSDKPLNLSKYLDKIVALGINNLYLNLSIEKDAQDFIFNNDKIQEIATYVGHFFNRAI